MSDDLIICSACGEPADSSCDRANCSYTAPKPLTLVQLHDGRPPLNDIPGRLRLLADQIERGEHPDTNSCLVILPTLWDYPGFYAYGDIDGNYNPIIHLELAKAFWTQKLVGEK